MAGEQIRIDTRVLARRGLSVVHGFDDGFASKVEVVVGVALHNHAATLKRCTESIFAQDTGDLNVGIVLLNDNSTDDWRESTNHLLERPNVAVLEANCGSAARARNAIIDHVEASLPTARWVARLDADDRFASPHSLAAAINLGDQRASRFVLGGNRLYLDGSLLSATNPVTRHHRDPKFILELLRQMAEGEADNEPPSCNFVLATHTGWRYPDLSSAEDHWLVADLLINHGDSAAILLKPYYCDYSLKGRTSQANLFSGVHGRSRKSLFEAASNWIAAQEMPGEVMGRGQEGVVRLINGVVEKRFHRSSISEVTINRLNSMLHDTAPFIPEPSWSRDEDCYCCRYPYVPSTAVEEFAVDEVREFLLFCLAKGIVCTNIKRDNFRKWPAGGLQFVDIGEGIVSMNVDHFVDAAARLYAIGVLGWGDDELRRRPHGPPTTTTLDGIPGFTGFYRELLCEHARRRWQIPDRPHRPTIKESTANVSLLIKACAMDAATLVHQAKAIVAQLEIPRRFNERILAIDPFPGPFLREYGCSDFDLLLTEARRLQAMGFIDRILVAPDADADVAAINHRWFGVHCTATHSHQGVPVSPQLWAFDQVETRYVLQCDIDVLVCRRDLSHDFLQDMLLAARPDDVIGVAFNIAHEFSSPAHAYDAAPGEYVPEVRCGLLDLKRLSACRPLPNELVDRKLSLTWYRSLQRYQEEHDLRTLRGGDPRTFYIHPSNIWKENPETLARVRDLVSQDRMPSIQHDHWDLEGELNDWTYPKRSESVIFLIKGRNTPQHKVERCLASLIAQDDQEFGTIMIDDGSDGAECVYLPHWIGPLRDRTTLIRRQTAVGRIPNMLTAIRDVCSNPESLIVILDMDDALMNASAVSMLRCEYESGADIIHAAMFRPDKPTRIYSPDYGDPRANRRAGDVWIHLRSFRKKLFDAIPDEALQIDGRWIDQCTDYAIMIPIAEMCRHPRYIPEYLYFHERTTPRTCELRRKKDAIIDHILAKPRCYDLQPQ